VSESPPAIHLFSHHAMATYFQVRIAGEQRTYAAQAAQAAFAVADQLEGLLSRFKQNSDIAAIAELQPGQRLRLSEATFACLEIARDMEAATRGAFSITATTGPRTAGPPRWSLDRAALSIVCESGELKFDLGAVGKGFALDRMAAELAEWECPAYLLVAGGSSVLAGDPPPGMPGWSTGLGGDNSPRRYWLARASLSGSGFEVKGRHIVDPRTRQPAARRASAWAFAPTAAVSDALSTACMVLDEKEIEAITAGREEWLVVLCERGAWRGYGARPWPPVAPA